MPGASHAPTERIAHLARDCCAAGFQSLLGPLRVRARGGEPASTISRGVVAAKSGVMSCSALPPGNGITSACLVLMLFRDTCTWAVGDQRPNRSTARRPAQSRKPALGQSDRRAAARAAVACLVRVAGRPGERFTAHCFLLLDFTPHRRYDLPFERGERNSERLDGVAIGPRERFEFLFGACPSRTSRGHRGSGQRSPQSARSPAVETSRRPLAPVASLMNKQPFPLSANIVSPPMRRAWRYRPRSRWITRRLDT